MARIIDPRVEKKTRDMLGLAIRGQFQELAALIHADGDEMYRQVTGMCLVAASYIAVDACDRWPTDADLHQLAEGIVREETRIPLGATDVYNYVSRAALGFESLDDALGSAEKAATLPVLITASMVFNLRPREIENWWEYLDQVWDATLTAESLDMAVLPALQVRAHRDRVLKARETQADS